MRFILRFIPKLHAGFTPVENVEADLRFDPKLLLNQKVAVDLVLVQQQAECWSNRNAWKDRETQTVFGDVAESRVERSVLVKVHKQEIAFIIE
jgi:hypothetical protein